MDIKFDNGKLTIVLPSKINAENVNDLREELWAIELPETAKEIVLEAKNLTYISSLGLRLILELQKKHKHTPVLIVNTDENVYRIFDDTGFTSILNIKRKLRFVYTSLFQMIGRGMYGAVYRINEEQILKVFFGTNSEEDIQPIIKTVRIAFVKGLPTTIPFEVVHTDKGIGIILELINSELLSNLIVENPQKLDTYISDMLKLSLLLANTKFEEGELRTRNGMLKTKLSGSAEFLTPSEMATIEKYIDAIPGRNTAVHGDFHAKNLMMSEGKLMLIDMDEFSCGHPLWDIANFYCIYQAMAHIDTKFADDVFSLGGKIPYEDFYFKIVGCTLAQAEIIWNKFFNGYFYDYSEKAKAKILKLVEFYSTFKFITFLVDICKSVKDNPEELAGKVRNIRYFLTKLENKNLPVLLKALDLWK